MAELIASFLFLINASASLYFDSLVDLIPFLIRFFFFCVLVSSFFRFMGKVAEIFLNWRRW